jgi:hypothetical protein
MAKTVARKRKPKNLEDESYVTRVAYFDFPMPLKHSPPPALLKLRGRTGIDVQVVVGETKDGALECELIFGASMNRRNGMSIRYRQRFE